MLHLLNLIDDGVIIGHGESSPIDLFSAPRRARERVSERARAGREEREREEEEDVPPNQSEHVSFSRTPNRLLSQHEDHLLRLSLHLRFQEYKSLRLDGKRLKVVRGIGLGGYEVLVRRKLGR